MINAPARKHHYLPCFYLKQFADNSGRVLRTFLDPRGQLREARFSPRQTGFETDLYSLAAESPLVSAPRSDGIETDVMGPIDNQAAPAMRKLIADPLALSDQERTDWAVFTNSRLERHPSRLSHRDQVMGQHALSRAKQFMDEGATLESRNTRVEVMGSMDIDVIARNLVRGAMVKEITRPEVIDYFKGFSWFSIHLDSTTDFQLATSDNPVVVNAGEPWPIQFLSVALGPADLFFMLRSKEVRDPDLIEQAILVHNIALFEQSGYVFSRDPLVDGSSIRTRKAAETLLKRSTWRRSGGG